MERIPIGILGATGVVGQNYIRLLADHPWFEIRDVAASSRSAGRSYAEATQDRWMMSSELPHRVAEMTVRDVMDMDSIPADIKLFFSATELNDKPATSAFEFDYASKGYPVVSNSSANRWQDDVPMLIPEINADHLELISVQQKGRGLPEGGFVTAKPNCSIQSYMVALHALREAGFEIKDVMVNTLQALSGAGYRGLTAPEMQDTVIPLIRGEEDKTVKEPTKIFARVENDKLVLDESIRMSALCTRVPVVDGHTALVHVNFKDKVPSLEQVHQIFSDFEGVPQKLALPMAPIPAIRVLEDDDRPQVKLDVDAGKGMAVSVGRIEEDTFFDLRFVALSHNAVRGAAGGAILTAELLVKEGYIT